MNADSVSCYFNRDISYGTYPLFEIHTFKKWSDLVLVGTALTGRYRYVLGKNRNCLKIWTDMELYLPYQLKKATKKLMLFCPFILITGTGYLYVNYWKNLLSQKSTVNKELFKTKNRWTSTYLPIHQPQERENRLKIFVR